MKRSSSVTISLFLLVFSISCSNGVDAFIADVQGPSEIPEASTASFSVSVAGDDVSSYDWTVTPPSAGTFETPHGANVEFHAALVADDLEAEILVSITLSSGAVLKSKKIVIKNVPGIPMTNEPPVAAAHSDFTTAERGREVHFFNDSTDPNGDTDIIKYEWDFYYDPAEGFNPSSDEMNPVHIYDETGSYLVQLCVTDSDGVPDTLDAPLEIKVVEGPIAPIAQAHAESTVITEGDFIQFFDDSIDANGPMDIVKREWDFSYISFEGLNAESMEINPAVQFTIPGNFQIQLRVTDISGLSDTLDQPIDIEVRGKPPVAMAHTLSTAVNEGESAQFFDDSTDPDGTADIVIWEWDFSYVPSEGFHVESEEQNPVFQFSSAGTFFVQLRVTDTYGLSDMLESPIEILVVSQGWALTWGGEGGAVGIDATAVDSEGNTYVAGYSDDYIDFDPGPGINPYDLHFQSYISKFDPEGNYLWTVLILGRITALCVGDFDGVFYCGYSDSYTYTNSIVGQVSGNGESLFEVNKLADNYDDYSDWYYYRYYNATDLVVDASLNVYILLIEHFMNGGYDKGGKILFYHSTEYSIVKYSQTGTQIWESPKTEEEFRSIEYRPDGKFLVQLDQKLRIIDGDGVGVWDADFSDRIVIYSVACDSNGNTYYIGHAPDGVDLDPGAGYYGSMGNSGMFLCKLDLDMNLIWCREWAGNVGYVDDYTFHQMFLSADQDGNTFITGYFSGEADYDPGYGVSSHTVYVPDAIDAFVIAMDAYGNYRWGAQFTTWTSGGFRLSNPSPDSHGYAHVGGKFWKFMDFDPGPGFAMIPSNHRADAFLIRLGELKIE